MRFSMIGREFAMIAYWMKEGKAKSFRFHHTIYSAQGLKDRLRQVGFQRITMFGDLEGSEYGTNARRLVAISTAVDYLLICGVKSPWDGSFISFLLGLSMTGNTV